MHKLIFIGMVWGVILAFLISPLFKDIDDYMELSLFISFLIMGILGKLIIYSCNHSVDVLFSNKDLIQDLYSSDKECDHPLLKKIIDFMFWFSAIVLFILPVLVLILIMIN